MLAKSLGVGALLVLIPLLAFGIYGCIRGAKAWKASLQRSEVRQATLMAQIEQMRATAGKGGGKRAATTAQPTAAQAPAVVAIASSPVPEPVPAVAPPPTGVEADLRAFFGPSGPQNTQTQTQTQAQDQAPPVYRPKHSADPDA